MYEVIGLESEFEQKRYSNRKRGSVMEQLLICV